MGTIEIQEIGTNRYAPEGANAVCLYGVEGADGLTLGQLVAAVCIRRCTHLEARSVERMNKMTQNNHYLQAMSGVCSQLAGGASLGDVAAVPDSYEMRKAARGCTVLEFLETECGLTVSQDAKNSWSYANRLAVIAQLKTAMDNANTTSQEDAIELQSMVNWRDVTFNASSGVVARYGNSGMNMAGNI